MHIVPEFIGTNKFQQPMNTKFKLVIITTFVQI